MRVTRPAGPGMVRPHGSASTNANSDAPSRLITCVESQPRSRWSRGDADNEPQGSRARIAMKERTSLTEECSWSASVPVLASSKEAMSVKAVSTAIQSWNQRDRVRVTTAREVGRVGLNRRLAMCAPFKDYSSEHESDVNASGGAEHGRYVRSTTPLHEAHMSMPTSSVPIRFAGRGDRRHSSLLRRVVLREGQRQQGLCCRREKSRVLARYSGKPDTIATATMSRSTVRLETRTRAVLMPMSIAMT